MRRPARTWEHSRVLGILRTSGSFTSLTSTKHTSGPHMADSQRTRRDGGAERTRSAFLTGQLSTTARYHPTGSTSGTLSRSDTGWNSGPIPRLWHTSLTCLYAGISCRLNWLQKYLHHPSGRISTGCLIVSAGLQPRSGRSMAAHS